MALSMTERRTKVLAQLIKVTQSWALRRNFDPGLAIDLRREAILLNHAHYLEYIPAYQRLAQQEGIGSLREIGPIKLHLMLPDEIFKSYDQNWLDERRFDLMNTWLSQIFHHPVEMDATGISDIDDWIAGLEEQGIQVVYSSGTSGAFSFVPRDQEHWDLFRLMSMAYIVPLMLHGKVGTAFQRFLVKAGSVILSPQSFVAMVRKANAASHYDAVFLDFNRGRTGNQTLAQELAPFFRKHCFLYETELSPAVLRLITRGAKSEQDQEQLARLQDVVLTHKNENYRRIVSHLKQSTQEGQNVFIFGTTLQYKELCETMLEEGGEPHLKSGSLILFGGGWKSFSGERISREALLSLMSSAFHLPSERIMEGYSMTEINAFMLRCDHGRFHIPPFIEPVILDDSLSILEGSELKGIFGFLDPLAITYPGFIISGDEVRYVEGECECGLAGPALTEIGRAQAREIKGCGGIVSSVSA
jgi:hypothetical protein